MISIPLGPREWIEIDRPLTILTYEQWVKLHPEIKEEKKCETCEGSGSIPHECDCELCEITEEECQDCDGSGEYEDSKIMYRQQLRNDLNKFKTMITANRKG